jgi:hypothetical protein
MDMGEFFERVEDTMLARFRETGFVNHAGDRGDNREELLREFLQKHLPNRYGVVKGQVVTKDGVPGHSADVIIYDALSSPLLFDGRTAVVPIEGVYGIVEVKSRLSKQELLDCMRKIEAFKKLAPRDLSVIQTREYVTAHRPSRPFGVALAYELADNSLESLSLNFAEEHARIHDVNYFTNLVCVLGVGLLHYEKVDLTAGERVLLLDTDEFVQLVQTVQKRERNGEGNSEVLLRIAQDGAEDRSFGRFFVYLLIMLAHQKLGVPDLGRYLDPDLPIQIVRES